MRVLAEMGLLLVLGLALAWLVGLRSDGVFIAGLLLAVSSPDWWNGCVPRNGLGSCVRRISSSPWRCLHGARSCRSSPTILHGCRPSPRPEPGLGHGLRQVAAPPVSRGPRPLAVPLPMQCVRPVAFAAARWIWVLPLIALWFARGTDRLQTLVMALVALLGFVLGRARASSDERGARCCTRRTARESSRATRSRIADIDEERAQSIRMATLGERTRIAREIHDNVGHLLTARSCRRRPAKRGQGDERYGRCARVRHVGATWMMR